MLSNQTAKEEKTGAIKNRTLLVLEFQTQSLHTSQVIMFIVFVDRFSTWRVVMRKILLLTVIALLWSGSAALAGQGMQDKQEGHSCPATCPEKNHEVTKTIADASLTGMIKCNHCDLHRSNSCQKVLQTADKKVFQFCPESVKTEDLEKLRGKEVQVKGTIKELKDADAVIHVETMKPVS